MLLDAQALGQEQQAPLVGHLGQLVAPDLVVQRAPKRSRGRSVPGRPGGRPRRRAPAARAMLIGGHQLELRHEGRGDAASSLIAVGAVVGDVRLGWTPFHDRELARQAHGLGSGAIERAAQSGCRLASRIRGRGCAGAAAPSSHAPLAGAVSVSMVFRAGGAPGVGRASRGDFKVRPVRVFRRSGVGAETEEPVLLGEAVHPVLLGDLVPGSCWLLRDSRAWSSSSMAAPRAVVSRAPLRSTTSLQEIGTLEDDAAAGGLGRRTAEVRQQLRLGHRLERCRRRCRGSSRSRTG